MKFKMYTDGGARGNPGPAAVGVLICNEDNEGLHEYAETIGEATNNIAEYRAFLAGLEQAGQLAAKLGARASETELECFLDSELVVRQLQGKYKIKNYQLQKLYDQAKTAEREFAAISYTHLRREANGMRLADQLVNHALDTAERKSRR